MKMVRFTSLSGKQIWINPKEIKLVHVDSDDNTLIFVDTDWRLIVKEPVVQVILDLEQQGK